MGFSMHLTMFWYVWAILKFCCFVHLSRCNAVNPSAFSNMPEIKNGLVVTETYNEDAEMDAFRLPTDVVPISYNLEMATDFKDMTYSGRVEIVVRARARTCQIVLNAKGLLVTGVEVIDKKSKELMTVVKHYLVHKNEQLTIVLNDTIRCLIGTRTYVVKVTFELSFRDDMVGFYKSSYYENNVTKWLAVTQFEPTFARTAFPCFDEPAFRVPFNVSIRRRTDQISLSNMPLSNSFKVKQSNMVWDYFQVTPPMPTYLVAFYIGEFYGLKTSNIGIYTHTNYIRQTEYIANKSPKLLEAMEIFTGVDFVLPKLDLLAIPDCIGAMENWGLNTYCDRLLLLTDDYKTKTKELVTTLVQHGFSKLWFGDLVTCAWWDYVWLKEGFATYFQFFATKMVEPDWRLEDVFVYQVHQKALESDQHPMHPMTGSVETPIRIKGMFDDISYYKGGAVLRMFQYAVTEENFRTALNLYLENNKYKAATPEDLWTAFEIALYDAEFELEKDISVTQFMKSWTEQAGYPLVNIVKQNNTFVITQKRFSVNYLDKIDTTKWIIGLTYTTNDNANFSKVLPTIWLKENQMVLPNLTEFRWYIFNLKSIGYFRVNYDVDNWNGLIDQLNFDCSVIHVLNRAQLIDDAFNLARASQIDYIMVLRLSEYLNKENDVVPWYSVKRGFEYLIYRMRRSSEYYKYLKTYIEYLSGFIFMKMDNLVVNHNITEHSIKTGWNAFSNWACKWENEVCTTLASSYFDSWSQGNRIPADIKDAAFCVGVKDGDLNVWNSILQVYVNSKSTSDRQSAQWALACSKDHLQLSKYLDFMFEGYDGPIRHQDFGVIYHTLSSSSEGISALIEFLTTKLDRIVKEVINGDQVVTSIYSLLASSVALDDELLQIDNLRKNSSVPEYLRKVFNVSYSKVDENLAWFNAYNIKIGEWSKNTVLELELDPDEPVSSSTHSSSTSPEEPTVQPSDQTPSSSSRVLINAQPFVYILLTFTANQFIECFLKQIICTY